MIQVCLYMYMCHCACICPAGIDKNNDENKPVLYQMSLSCYNDSKRGSKRFLLNIRGMLQVDVRKDCKSNMNEWCVHFLDREYSVKYRDKCQWSGSSTWSSEDRHDIVLCSSCCSPGASFLGGFSAYHSQEKRCYGRQENLAV